MSVFKIYYNNGAKMMAPVKSEEEYRQLRGTAYQQQLVNQARLGNQKAKQRLLQFCYSCIPGEDGALKGCQTPSTCVGMDVDLDPSQLVIQTTEGRKNLSCLNDSPSRDSSPSALNDIKGESIVEQILAKKEELGLLMLERSASKGFHLVFRRRPEMSQEENLRWASNLLGVPYDEGAKDITRVFFSTTDSKEDLIFLDPEIFDLSPAPPKEGSVSDDQGEVEEYPDEPMPQDNDLSPLGESEGASPVAYDGIPYSSIIKKYWEMNNGGKEPVTSNRDTLTFELAMALRHICGFDRNLLDKVIPCYDGFPQEQKMKCIDSALGEKRSLMPQKLRNVLTAVKAEYADDREALAAMENVEQQDYLYYFKQFDRRALPQGIYDSIMAAGPALAMPTLLAICPAIGALATGVKLVNRKKVNTLNLLSFVVGESGSGKGQMDDIVEAWMYEEAAKNEIYFAQEDAVRAKTRSVKGVKQTPEDPHNPVRYLTLNNTVANIAERLGNTIGVHAYSYTPEADTVAKKWESNISDFSVMIRQAYDASRYDREAKSADAVTVHIPHLLWNVAMCGTADALYRVVDNYTDGFLSRLAIGSTPDNTFQPEEEDPYVLTERQRIHIQQVAHLLPLMKGTIELPKLEQKSREWVEALRLRALKNFDKVLARCRMRDHVTTSRMVVCMMLCKVCEKLIKEHGLKGAETKLRTDPECWIPLMKRMQTPAMLAAYDVIADSLVETELYYFRSKLEAAYRQESGSVSNQSLQRGRNKNDNIYERLSPHFTIDEATQESIREKGSGVGYNMVRQMLKNWQNHGMVDQLQDGSWQKTA